MLEQFKTINEVSEIWERDRNDLKEYFILLKNNTYNPILMRKFFNIERQHFEEYYDIHYALDEGIDRTHLINYTKIY
ncbi:MAG: hypothetical protein PHO58_05795 [Bacilli bacterium]|nr:hypothetical protein [Bacilli bacterium]